MIAERILAIMGSGETAPTMVTVHRRLTSRLGSQQTDAVLLDTPYAFQENAADISARARSYFATSVGLEVAVLASADGPVSGARVSTADWVFAGPGSPSYALSRWRGGSIGTALRDRVTSAGGLTVLASAAAATAGVAAVPVYEIYKAGAEPHWLDGLDLLSACGLPVVVIPHYDNAEGGTHDTRFCYLGERRLAQMESALPPGTAVLGVDEHTALVLDFGADTAEVMGRGGVTVRRAGQSVVFPAPALMTLGQLREAVRTGAAESELVHPPLVPRQATPADDGLLPLPDLVNAAERQFERALTEADGTLAVQTILELEFAINAWSADTDEDQGTGQARAVLRAMIARLTSLVCAGLRDPAEPLRPAVDPLLALRAQLRAEGHYPAADAIRDALTAGGVRISDSSSGTSWSLDAAAPRV